MPRARSALFAKRKAVYGTALKMNGARRARARLRPHRQVRGAAAGRQIRGRGSSARARHARPCRRQGARRVVSISFELYATMAEMGASSSCPAQNIRRPALQHHPQHPCPPTSPRRNLRSRRASRFVFPFHIRTRHLFHWQRGRHPPRRVPRCLRAAHTRRRDCTPRHP